MPVNKCERRVYIALALIFAAFCAFQIFALIAWFCARPISTTSRVSGRSLHIEAVACWQDIEAQGRRIMEENIDRKILAAALTYPSELAKAVSVNGWDQAKIDAAASALNIAELAPPCDFECAVDGKAVSCCNGSTHIFTQRGICLAMPLSSTQDDGIRLHSTLKITRKPASDAGPSVEIAVEDLQKPRRSFHVFNLMYLYPGMTTRVAIEPTAHRRLAYANGGGSSNDNRSLFSKMAVSDIKEACGCDFLTGIGENECSPNKKLTCVDPVLKTYYVEGEVKSSLHNVRLSEGQPWIHTQFRASVLGQVPTESTSAMLIQFAGPSYTEMFEYFEATLAKLLGQIGMVVSSWVSLFLLVYITVQMCKHCCCRKQIECRDD